MSFPPPPTRVRIILRPGPMPTKAGAALIRAIAPVFGSYSKTCSVIPQTSKLPWYTTSADGLDFKTQMRMLITSSCANRRDSDSLCAEQFSNGNSSLASLCRALKRSMACRSVVATVRTMNIVLFNPSTQLRCRHSARTAGQPATLRPCESNVQTPHR